MVMSDRNIALASLIVQRLSQGKGGELHSDNIIAKLLGDAVRVLNVQRQSLLQSYNQMECMS